MMRTSLPTGIVIDEDSYVPSSSYAEKIDSPRISTPKSWPRWRSSRRSFTSLGPSQAIAIRNFVRASHLQRPDALGRFTNVSRRRYLSPRLVGRSTIQNTVGGKAPDMLTNGSTTSRVNRRAHRHAATRLELPIRADPCASSSRPCCDHRPPAR